ncbi:AAA family ATPase [Methylobacterium sp. J-092]|uniref:AAA family ATPase n=1 Tax=Methylobacterium sp. J-092 TaxID=2836667 RepID=UPI001FB8C0D5|nr:AAA family ATPase [Methylobacterium sp. J-092]MCJ2007023.1 AAA family ATPase [Methylobacterium sp. J-092]
MPKMSDHAGRARAQAVLSVRLARDSFISKTPANGGIPNTSRELLAGAEFLGEDVRIDVAAFLFPLVKRGSKHRLPPRLYTTLRRLQDDPTLANVRVARRSCALAVSRADAHWEGEEMLGETRMELDDLVMRCWIWEAGLGCPGAAAHCAGLAFDAYRMTSATPAVSPLPFRLLRSAIEYLIASRMPPVGAYASPYVPEARSDQLLHAYGDVRDLAYFLGVVVQGIAEGPVKEEPEAAPDDDDLSALADLSEDRSGIVRNPAPAKPVEPVEDGRTYSAGDILFGPTRMVLASTEHLPKSRKGDNHPTEEARKIAGKRLPLVGTHRDLPEIQAELDAEFVHLGEITGRILSGLVGRDWSHVQPTLLVGPPGAAKTRYARRLGEVLGLPVSVHSLGGSSDASFMGTSRQWSTGRFSVPLQEIVKSGIANPLIVLDELDKAGHSHRNGSILDVLVNLLGGETAARYSDPYLECATDLSAVSYVLTANSLGGLPKPLLDRLRIIEIPTPGPEHLLPLATSILDDVRADRGLDDVWCPGLEAWELDALAEHWPGGSLRALRRLIEAVVDARSHSARRQ